MVSSEGWHGSEVPTGLAFRIFGVSAFRRNVNAESEAWFFLGRYFRALKELRKEYDMTPTTHRIAVYEAEGYRFPEKILSSKNVRKEVGSYDYQVVRQEPGVLA